MLPMGKAILLAGKKKEVGVTKFDFTMDWMSIRTSSSTIPDLRSVPIKDGFRLNGKTYDLYCTQCEAYPIKEGDDATALAFTFTTSHARLPETATYTPYIICYEECSGAYIGRSGGNQVVVTCTAGGEASVSFTPQIYEIPGMMGAYLHRVKGLLKAVSNAGKTYPVFKFSLVGAGNV